MVKNNKHIPIRIDSVYLTGGLVHSIPPTAKPGVLDEVSIIVPENWVGDFKIRVQAHLGSLFVYIYYYLNRFYVLWF